MNTPLAFAPTATAVTILHDATPAEVDAAAISPGLCSIVPSPRLLSTILRRLAADPEARLTLAVADSTIVSRAVVGPSFGRWRSLPNVREFALEVARGWRGHGLAARLMAAALTDPAAESEILVAFALPSAWDAEHEGLSPARYCARLRTLLGRAGFQPAGTDEPEVRFGRDAALLVRIGGRVPTAPVAAFEQARYLGQAGRIQGHLRAA